MLQADFMAFPFSQADLLNRTPNLEIDDYLFGIDLIHVTSAPPIAARATVREILDDHVWFRDTMEESILCGEVLYGLQHPPLDATEKDLVMLHEEGIDICGIAYDTANIFGGGFLSPNAPLTDEGRTLLRQLATAGIIIDLSHAGHQTARDVLKYLEYSSFSSQVVATHSACHAVYPHLRNLPDDVLKKIAEHDGVVGLPAVTWLLHAADNTLEPFFTHLDHLINIVGEHGVCIGSDGGYYRMPSALEELRLHILMTETLDPDGTKFGARLPNDAEEIHGPHRLFALAERIADRYSSRIAELVVGENLLDFRESTLM